MKKTRRTFLKNTGQLTLATSFTFWWMSCESKEVVTTKSFLEVSPLFSDNMVLQRDQPIPIWGWGNKGATIHLFFNKKKYTSKVQSDGRWKFNLPALPSGKTHQIKIQNDLHEITISNILMGDVFLCSGQSNMEWPMSRVENVEDEIAQANDNQIRHFKVPVSFSTTLEEKIKGGKWKITTPENVVDFSAAAYFFAKNIRQYHDVPIGLINATKGSTSIKMWLSKSSLELPSLENLIEKEIEKRIPHLQKRFGNFSLAEKSEDWSSPNLIDDNWKEVELPLKWGESDFMEILGSIWFRKTFFLKEIPTAIIKISIGQIDDADTTFLNGKKIGEGKQVYKPARLYEIEPSFFQKGINVLAVRVENHGDFGGIFGNANDLFFQINNKKESLAGTWKVKVEKFQYNKNRLFESGSIPSVLYNAMIHPLQQFPIKTILWYQGEGDVVENVNDLFEYRFLFEKLIQTWRAQFGNPTLPLVFAQLSNAHNTCKNPKDSRWARLRESQSSILKSIPQTAQVINIDSGKHENSMHPQNKPELGKRFALAVRRLVYQEEIISSGPIFQKMEKHGKELHLYFSVIENRLLLKFGSQVNELAIAGSDRNFRWANNRIEKNKIIVWHEEINEPVAVRYAWCDNPLYVNLYNVMNLPAAPFRTDNWEWKK